MNDAHHPLNALPQGYPLQEYELVRVLGFGGFGMTYLGFDHNLDKGVAVKEYLPADIATRTAGFSVAPQASDFRDDFEWGLERFLDEARILARFHHPNIIGVYRYFEAHGTAYIVMEYAEGETLSQILQHKQTLKEGELKAILYPVLEGLEVVHGADFLHRDIKPGNIILRDEDCSPVLLDFGAARHAISARSRSMTSIITPGYAPIEQYSTRGNQGPWTDIYALGAVCYHALTGETPDDAADRVRQDPLAPAVERCGGRASGQFLGAIDWALRVDEGDRPQTVPAWRAALEGEPPDEPTGPTAVATPSAPRQIKGGETRSAPPTEDVPAVSRKKRGRVAAVICILGLLIGGGYSYYEFVYKPDQRRREQDAERARQAARQEAATRERERRISVLLSDAAEDLASDRLASPAAANAWEKYQAVLILSPGHQEATAGLDSIISRYVGMFESALDGKEFERAEGYVSRIRGVWADAPVLSGLEGRLSAARNAETRRIQEAARAKEAERRRQAKIERYTGKFNAALSGKYFDTAGGYIDSLRRTDESGSKLSDMEGRLSSAREAEVLRREERRVGRVFRDCAACPEMVIVPSGSYTMGSPGSEEGREDDEGPRHVVRIDDRFAVGVYEVTFAQWDACANAGGCGGYIPDDEGWGRGNRPVINVNWQDALSYVRWLSGRTGETYRLLSESEWEYVARAGTTTSFHFGKTISTYQANYNGNYTYGSGIKGVYRERTLAVGSFPSNAWGLHDVHGNVWEWVGDCWNASYGGAPSGGSAWESGDCSNRILRGGSWFSFPRLLRSAVRSRFSAEDRDDYIGFRVARTLTPEK